MQGRRGGGRGRGRKDAGLEEAKEEAYVGQFRIKYSYKHLKELGNMDKNYKKNIFLWCLPFSNL